MRDSVKKMDEIINQLVSWLNDYPEQLLTGTQKQRITHILSRLSKAQPISLKKLNQSISEDAKRLEYIEKLSHTPITDLPEFKDKFNYRICQGCGSRISKEKFNKHKKSCAKYKELIFHKKKFLNESSSAKGTSITSDIPGKNYEKTENELKNHDLSDRQQDGSRDFYQIRDNGKFGSMSSFDDYGDESTP